MDLTTVVGVILAIVSIVLAFLIDEGRMSSLICPTAMMIVFGGTFGATMAGFAFNEIILIPKIFKTILFNKSIDTPTLITTIVELAEKARREGLLYLEGQLKEIESPFLQRGVQLVVDGTDPELVRNIMETEMYTIQERHKLGQEIFFQAGGFAPTMGIIGTVMGLIHVLGSCISDLSKLGPAIALAFTATLYGISSANVLYYPIANRLKNIGTKERVAFEMMIEGLLALQAGNNPILIRERLIAYLNPKQRTFFDDEKEAEGGDL